MKVKKLVALLLTIFITAAFICGCVDQNGVSDDMSSSADPSFDSDDTSSNISSDASSDTSSDDPSDDPSDESSDESSDDTSSSDPLDPMAEYQKYLELFIEHYNTCQRILYQLLSYDENDYIMSPCYYIAEENGKQVLKCKYYKFYRVTDEEFTYMGALINYMAKYNADCADWLCELCNDSDPANDKPPRYIEGPHCDLYMADPQYRWGSIESAQLSCTRAEVTAENSYFEVENGRLYCYLYSKVCTEIEAKNVKYLKTIETDEYVKYKYYLSEGSSAFNRHPKNPNEDELQELLEYFINRENEIMALFTGDSYYDKNDSLEFVINYMWWGEELIPMKYNYYRLTIDGINSIRDLIDYCALDYYDKSAIARSFFYDGDEQPYFIETDRGVYMLFKKDPDEIVPTDVRTYDIERSTIEIKDGIMYIRTRRNSGGEYATQDDYINEYKYCDGRWRFFRQGTERHK